MSQQSPSSGCIGLGQNRGGQRTSLQSNWSDIVTQCIKYNDINNYVEYIIKK